MLAPQLADILIQMPPQRKVVESHEKVILVLWTKFYATTYLLMEENSAHVWYEHDVQLLNQIVVLCSSTFKASG